MKVFYYCQHVLGIGHLQRSLTVCQAIAQENETTLILGGPATAFPPPADIRVLQLPGLKMDNNFQNLQPCEEQDSLEVVKKTRSDLLFSCFQQEQPDVFITELYPFGRKAFGFELDPLLAGIKDGKLKRCLCLSSVRDILVEKQTDLEKFEKRVVHILNSYFDGILVHSDSQVIKLNETFSRMNEIVPPLHYTGFVTSEKCGGLSGSIREHIGITPQDTLIVVSIGGGNVGSELLLASIEAARLLHTEDSFYFQIFCGPFCDPVIYNSLKKIETKHIRVNRFSNRFQLWLSAADLSISMAGYNTCMNLLSSGVPSIVYPFQQNREQRLRAERLASIAPIMVLKNQPTAETLAEKIRIQLRLARKPVIVRADGAAESARQISLWYTTLLKK